MKRIATLFSLLLICVVSVEWLQAQAPTSSASRSQIMPHLPGRFGLPPIKQPFSTTKATTFAALVSGNVTQVGCPVEAQALGATCGTLNVPLDRKHPKQATIPIYFELYQHSGSYSESAILVNFGGPGNATTGFRSFAFYLFGANLAAHDL